MRLVEGSSRACALSFVAALAACEAGEPASGLAPVESDLGLHEQALCLRGPAFPSCYGSCCFLDCSPIDPGACCACDTGCVARGDCCCDYHDECVHDDIPTCGVVLPPAEAAEHVSGVAAPAGALYVAGERARPAAFASDLVDGFLRRLNPTTLATVWERSIDNCFWDSINGVAALASGDVVVVGSTRDGPFAATPARIMLRRYSSAGALLWQVSPVSPLGQATGLAIAVDPADQSLVITGAVTTATDMIPLVARFGPDGELRFMRGLSTLSGHVGRALAVSSTSKIAIAAQAGTVAKTIALSATGTLQWNVSEAASTTAGDVAFDGAEIVSASTVQGSGTRSARMARYKSTGVLRFSRSLDLGIRHWNPVTGLAVLATGDAVLAGNVSQFDGTQRPWLARYTAAGVLSWSRVRATPTVLQVVDVALAGATAFSAAQDTAALARAVVVRDAL
jgi:outer membrane protein assembly factor BamB